jgi:hypothetical protein
LLGGSSDFGEDNSSSSTILILDELLNVAIFIFSRLFEVFGETAQSYIVAVVKCALHSKVETGDDVIFLF